VAASLGYLVISSVPGLLVWRVFHAMGLATFSTAAASLSGDLAAPERRGTTMGIFGLAQPAALSVGPAVGAAVLGASSYPALFLFTALTALFALACVLPISEDEGPKRAAPVSAVVWSTPGVLPSVAASAALQFAASIAYGTFVSFIAVVARERGLAVVGASFTLLALSSLGIRLVAGRLYDSWGPRAILPPGLISLAIGMALLGVTASAPGFLVAAVLAGAGIGSTHTTLVTRVVERSPAENRGSAVALFISCWELGVGGGTILMGRLAEAVGFTRMYLVVAVLCLSGLGGLRFLTHTPGLPPRDLAPPKEP
jgi:predicted MFS family arabinose efflux permease